MIRNYTLLGLIYDTYKVIEIYDLMHYIYLYQPLSTDDKYLMIIKGFHIVFKPLYIECNLYGSHNRKELKTELCTKKVYLNK